MGDIPCGALSAKQDGQENLKRPGREVHGQSVADTESSRCAGGPVSEPSLCIPPVWTSLSVTQRKDFWGGGDGAGEEEHGTPLWSQRGLGLNTASVIYFRGTSPSLGFLPWKRGQCGTPGQAVVGTAWAFSKCLLHPFSLEEFEVAARCYMGSPSLHGICPELPSLGRAVLELKLRACRKYSWMAHSSGPWHLHPHPPPHAFHREQATRRPSQAPRVPRSQ